MRITESQLNEKQKEGKIRGYVLKGGEKKSKYRNEKVTIDGIRFDSKKESRRYLQLRMLQTAGEISELRTQVPFELNEGGSHSLKYFADFTYIRNGEFVVEDVKGYETKLFRKKENLMLKIYQIVIKKS